MQMLPLKINTEKAKNNILIKINTEKGKNSNILINLWNILFHKRNGKGGPKKILEITTYLGEDIVP